MTMVTTMMSFQLNPTREKQTSTFLHSRHMPHLQAVDLFFGPEIIQDTLNNKPIIPGIVALLQSFLVTIHAMEVRNKDADASTVVSDYFSIVQKIHGPFEETYRNRTIFDITED